MGVGWVPNSICHTLLLIIRVSKKTSVQGQPKQPVQWGAWTPRSCERPTIKRRINPAVVGEESSQVPWGLRGKSGAAWKGLRL